jgi:hypothetical protein
MRQPILATLACALLVGGCAYTPTLSERVHVVDSPVDVTGCRRLGTVSGATPTGPTFAGRLAAMRVETAALGGTDLYLPRRSRGEWAFVSGVAYHCPTRPEAPLFRRQETTIRARG